MALPTLEAYLIAAQDEAKVWLWQRPREVDAQGQRQFPAEATVVVGGNAQIPLHAFGFSLPLAAIYCDIL